MDGHLSGGTEHQKAWWGLQACMDCNPLGLNTRRPTKYLPNCESCDGSGWTVSASLAREPWSEVIHNLWIGGHDFQPEGYLGIRTKIPSKEMFNTVVSMYSRPGFEPGDGVEHHEFLVPDGLLEVEELIPLVKAAKLVSERVQEGKSVLSRCQAGLNRSSLVAGLAMIFLGFSGVDVVQMIRRARSPWALCNPYFVDILEKMSVQDLTILIDDELTTEQV